MRVRSIVVFWTLFLALLGGRAKARMPEDSDWRASWDWPGQVSAIIDCHDGQETLRVATVSPPAAGAGWILAVPARAENVTVTWRDNLPRLSGRLPKSRVHEQLDWIPTAANATQLYPLLYYYYFAPSLAQAAVISAPVCDVTRGGLRCTLQNADSVDQFRQLIAESGLDLALSEMQRLAKFADGRHCLAIITIGSMADYKACLSSANYGTWGEANSALWHFFAQTDRMPYLEFSFPSQQSVMPAYSLGKVNVPWTESNLVVLGYAVPPKGYAINTANPNNSLYVRHFRGVCTQFRAPYYYDLCAPGRGVAYTRMYVENDAPPEEVTFTAQTGADFAAIDHGYSTYASPAALVTMSIVWIACCSYVGGGITGLLFWRGWQRYALLGLWNMATIIGLRLRLAKYPEIRHPRLYTATFSVVFLVMNLLGSAFLTRLLERYWQGPS
jgi:hypothetical protein